MVAQAPDGRTGRLAGAAGIALLLAGLTLLLEPPSWRPVAAALLAAGLAVGVVAAMRRPSSGRSRTPMERLNDAAFLVVIAAVALIAVRLARPWTAALPGLVGGALLGLTLRPRLGGGAEPPGGAGGG
jgi:cobalamin synthase